jgi:hypothetical protein
MKIPNFVKAKLAALEEQVDNLTRELTNTERAIADARRRLSGSFRTQTELDDLNASLKQLVADQPSLERNLCRARAVLSNVRTWLDQLPDHTQLEPVSIDVNGFDLDDVRARIAEAEREISELLAAPTRSADIEARVRAYVQGMARPQITGIGDGERLKVIWPGAGFDTRGPREDRADVLPLMALLHGEAMVAALMREVECVSNTPLPRLEREKRIAELQAELGKLRFIEEPLVSAAIARGEDVQHSASAPPEAVLQVRVVEAKRASRAA